MNPTVKGWLSVIMTTFAGAFVGALSPALTGGVPAASQWKPILITALVAGVAAVVHLYQPSPAPSSSIAKSRGFISIRTLTVVTFLGCAGFTCGIFPEAGCTAAQVKTIESGIPADLALVGCVLDAALGGATLAVVATTCGEDAVTAGTILVTAATESPDAGAGSSAFAAKIEASPACQEAWKLPELAALAKKLGGAYGPAGR